MVGVGAALTLGCPACHHSEVREGETADPRDRAGASPAFPANVPSHRPHARLSQSARISKVGLQCAVFRPKRGIRQSWSSYHLKLMPQKSKPFLMRQHRYGHIFPDRFRCIHQAQTFRSKTHQPSCFAALLSHSVLANGFLPRFGSARSVGFRVSVFRCVWLR